MEQWNILGPWLISPINNNWNRILKRCLNNLYFCLNSVQFSVFYHEGLDCLVGCCFAPTKTICGFKSFSQVKFLKQLYSFLVKLIKEWQIAYWKFLILFQCFEIFPYLQLIQRKWRRWFGEIFSWRSWSCYS